MGRRRWDQGDVAQAHPRRHRRLAAAAADRLHRPLPAPRPRPRDAPRRDARAPSTTWSARARCATSAARTSSPTRWPGPSAAARRSAWCASTRCSPATTCCSAQIERELLPLCAEEGVGVIPYNPLAGGFLTGKHHRAGAPTEGTRFTLGDAPAQRYQERYWHEREFADRRGAAAPRRRGGHVPGPAGGGVGAGATRRSPRPSSAPAGRSSSTTPRRGDDTARARVYARIDDLTRAYRSSDALR